MTITIFTKTVTETSLLKLESVGEKYDGLYVDMSNPEERKFVKNQAIEIDNLLKKLDRSRIDISKNFKIQVEAEAKLIRNRLEVANKPFSALIDEWKSERKKILDAQKAHDLAIEKAKQYASDYDEAIIMNKLWDFEAKEKLEAERLELERIKSEAEEKARLKAEQDAQEAKEKAERIAQQKIDDANKAKAEAQIALEKAEREKKEQAERLEQEKQQAVIEAELKAKHEAEELERKRIMEEKERLRIEAEKKRLEEVKAADIEHRRSINKGSMNDLVANGIDKDLSIKIIKLIASGKIKNISIDY